MHLIADESFPELQLAFRRRALTVNEHASVPVSEIKKNEPARGSDNANVVWVGHQNQMCHFHYILNFLSHKEGGT